MNILNIYIGGMHCWSDFSVVLFWITDGEQLFRDLQKAGVWQRLTVNWIELICHLESLKDNLVYLLRGVVHLFFISLSVSTAQTLKSEDIASRILLYKI